MNSRLITARFAGKCRVCGKAVAKGDPVYFAKHYGVRCQSCGMHDPSDPPLPSKRSTKSPSPRQRSSEPPPTPPTEPTKTAPVKLTKAERNRVSERGPDGVWRFEHDSISDAVADAFTDYAQTDGNRREIDRRHSETLTGSDRWGNCFTQEKFLAEVSNPSPHLLAAVEEMKNEIVGELDLPDAPRRKVRRGQDYGDELDADRFLNREPNAWDRSNREMQPRHVVTIGCNVAVHCGRKPEQLLYRGAAALALADVLTQQGVSVGIVVFKSVTDPTDQVGCAVTRYPVKDPLMPLDVGAVAFAMCEIAFARIVGVHGAARHYPGALEKGYGYSANLPAMDVQGIDYLIEQTVLSKDSAVEWIRSQLKKEVCHVESE